MASRPTEHYAIDIERKSTRLEHKLEPLTPEEKEYAGEHYAIMYKVMYDLGVDVDDCYEFVVFHYLRAVKNWFNKPGVQENFDFGRYAYMGCKAGVMYYWQKKKEERERYVSLFEPTKGGLTKQHTKGKDKDKLTYENAIPYERDDFAAINNDETDPAEIREAKEKRRVVKAIMGRLGQAEQRRLRMSADGLSAAQIGRIEKTDPDNIRNSLYTVRKKIANMGITVEGQPLETVTIIAWKAVIIPEPKQHEANNRRGVTPEEITIFQEYISMFTEMYVVKGNFKLPNTT